MGQRYGSRPATVEASPRSARAEAPNGARASSAARVWAPISLRIAGSSSTASREHSSAPRSSRTTYEREELIEQTRLTLLQKQSLENIVPKYETRLRSISRWELDLQNRMQTTRSLMSSLQAKRNVFRTGQATDKEKQILDDVQELLADNEVFMSNLKEPVPTFEELSLSVRFPTQSSEQDRKTVLEFLRAGLEHRESSKDKRR